MQQLFICITMKLNSNAKNVEACLCLHKNPKVFGAIDVQSCLAPFYLSFFFQTKGNL